MSKRQGYGALRPRPYRGGDRRSLIAAPAPGGQPQVAAGLVIALWIAVALAVALGVPLPAGPVLLGIFAGGAAAVSVVAAMLCALRWRLVGDAAALWLGLAVLAVGGSVLGSHAVALAGPGSGGVGDALGWVPQALRLAALWLLWRALRTSQVDAALRPDRAAATAAAAVLAAGALLWLAPGLARVLASRADALGPLESTAAGSALLAGVLLLLAALHARRGWRERNRLHLWSGVALLALGLGESLWLLPAVAGPAWAATPALLAVVGLLSLAAGSVGELARTYDDQRGRLFETVTSELTAEAKVRAEQFLAQERAHEARNALTAIEGASRTLETYRDRLDAETQASLSQAITTEIARLQRLVSPEETTRTTRSFRVAETLSSVVVGARTQGTSIDVHIPDGLVARGRPGETAEVVQNLIENARRYAPGSRVVVSAEQQRGGVVVRVADRGPGVPRAEHEAIFGRGYRGQGADGSEGSGLGLYICARLMHEQEGDLWVEDRPGGGASFALWLPEPAEPPATCPAADTPDGASSAASNVYPLFGGVRQPAREIDDGAHLGQTGLGHDRYR